MSVPAEEPIILDQTPTTNPEVNHFIIIVARNIIGEAELLLTSADDRFPLLDMGCLMLIPKACYYSTYTDCFGKIIGKATIYMGENEVEVLWS